MKRVMATASLALLFAVAAAGQQPQPVIQGLGEAQTILNVLATARLSASIEYSGKCGPNVLIPDLPPIREPQKPYPTNPTDTLRTMFSIDGRILVSQESKGIIRVVKTGVQTDILDIKINHLSFDGISDPDNVLDVVLGAPEVQTFIRAHGIGQPFYRYSVPLYKLPGLKRAQPTSGVSSISGELNDVTLADALDYVFWLYQDCETLDQQRVVYFGLFPTPGRMWPWQEGTTLVR
jgi:hypothetical protein